jgi:predicted kinase
MKKLIVLVGIPGSGKSFWCNTHFPSLTGTSSVISRDSIRFSLVEEGQPYFSREKEVYRAYITEIKNALSNFDNVIADATHLNQSSRTKLLRSLGKSLEDVEVIAMVMPKDLNRALRQNEKRSGTRAYVPQEQISKMSKGYSDPTFEEGFDKIYFYKSETISNQPKYLCFERGE